MEQMGQSFFAGFVNMIWLLRWPLGLFLSAYVLRDLGRLRPPEQRYATLMFCYFFLITFSYWLIKPIKKALLLGQYHAAGWTVLGGHLDAAQVELVAKGINALLAVLATVFFARIASRFKRDKLALLIIILFSLGFAAFGLLASYTSRLAVWLFYFYGDIFITLMVAAFFAFLNDSGNSRMARRLYGLVGLGGVFGGFLGSTVVATHFKQTSPQRAVWICVGLLVLMAVAAWVSGRQIKPTLSKEHPPTEPLTNKESTGKKEARALIYSPYFLGIALIVGLYEMVSAIMTYQFTSTALHFVSGEQLGAHFANVYSFSHFISLLLQIFLTRSIMTHMGMEKALLLMPLTVLIGEAGFVLWPGLLLGSFLNTFDNSLAYSINQSAKEALYVPMPPEEKYTAKALIDIFVLRFSKAIALAFGVLLTMVFTGFENLRWLSFILFGLLGIWWIAVRQIGPAYKRMTVRRA